MSSSTPTPRTTWQTMLDQERATMVEMYRGASPYFRRLEDTYGEMMAYREVDAAAMEHSTTADALISDGLDMVEAIYGVPSTRLVATVAVVAALGY